MDNLIKIIKIETHALRNHAQLALMNGTNLDEMEECLEKMLIAVREKNNKVSRCPIYDNNVISLVTRGIGKGFCKESFQAGVKQTLKDLFHTSEHKLKDKIIDYMQVFDEQE